MPAVLPTVTQTVGVKHEILVNAAPQFCPPSSDQAVPSHCSVRLAVVAAPCVGVLMVWPTAVQAEDVGHDTLKSWLRALTPATGAGLGLDTIDQEEPSHCSMRVCAAVVLEDAEPTAMHSEAEGHEIAVRSLFTAVLVLGLGTIDQLVPFHCSIRVWLSRAPAEPTAMQDVGEVHETPWSTPRFPPETPVLGLGETDQADPFHCSMRGPLAYEPVAMQNEAEVQETASRGPAKVPLVLGLGRFPWTVSSAPWPTMAQYVAEGHDTASGCQVTDDPVDVPCQ